MKVLSLFDGMSCGQIALNRIGVKPEVYYAAEVDKYAIKVTQANYPDTVQLGDVTKWREWDIDWASIDLLIGGSPCQGFSFAGKQLAFDDPRSKLFFVYVDILNHIKSVNPSIKFMLENVKMKKEFLAVISEQLGVEPVFINSALVSAQNRQRYYWCNWKVEQPEDRGVDAHAIFSGLPASSNRNDNGERIVTIKDKYNTIVANYYKGCRANSRPGVLRCKGLNGKSFDELSKDDFSMLTPNQCEALQTVPDNYTNHVSNTQRYKMLGNGFTVEVIAHIFSQMR